MLIKSSQTAQRCAQNTLAGFPSFPSSTAPPSGKHPLLSFVGIPHTVSALTRASTGLSSLSVYVLFLLFYKNGLMLSSQVLFMFFLKSPSGSVLVIHLFFWRATCYLKQPVDTKTSTSCMLPWRLSQPAIEGKSGYLWFCFSCTNIVMIIIIPLWA